MDVDNTIVIALISFAGTTIGTLGGILATNRLTIYRIEQLEKKVEKHNSVVERVFHLEEEKAVCEEKIKVINHRIEDLEHINK